MLSWPLLQVAGRPTALLVSAIYLPNAMILSTCIFYYSYLNYLLDQYCFRRVSFNIILLGLQRKTCHQDKRNTIRYGSSFALSTATHYAALTVLEKNPPPPPTHPPFMANAILNFHFFNLSLMAQQMLLSRTKISYQKHCRIGVFGHP